MKKGVVITLPKFDDVTEYLHTFSKPIIDTCEQNDIKFRKIEKDNVTKKNVEREIKSYDYNCIIFNGHGSMDSICGHKNEVLIKSRKNEEILKNRVVYARACWASLELGSSYTDKGDDSCFIGYDLEFTFLYNPNWVTNPSKDNVAKIFFETSNRVPIGLIKGQTATQANENSKKSMLKAINRLLKNPEKDSQAMAQALWDNYSGQSLLGKENYLI